MTFQDKINSILTDNIKKMLHEYSSTMYEKSKKVQEQFNLLATELNLDSRSYLVFADEYLMTNIETMSGRKDVKPCTYISDPSLIYFDNTNEEIEIELDNVEEEFNIDDDNILNIIKDLNEECENIASLGHESVLGELQIIINLDEIEISVKLQINNNIYSFSSLAVAESKLSVNNIASLLEDQYGIIVDWKNKELFDSIQKSIMTLGLTGTDAATQIHSIFTEKRSTSNTIQSSPS